MSANLQSYKVAFNEVSSDSKFDNLVQTVEDALNGVGDTSKTAWAAGQILSLAQLKQDGATSGQVLGWNGSAWAATNQTQSTIYPKTTEKDVTNTAAETDLLNGEITIGAGVMSSSKMVRARLQGDFLDTVGVAFTLRLKFGATTWYADTTTLTGQANRRPWGLNLWIGNLGASNSQDAHGVFAISTTAVASPVTGLGRINNTGNLISELAAAKGALTVDTSVGQALAVTVQWASASVNQSFRLESARVEVI